MANFHNPNQKGPDFGQGLTQMIQEIFQMLIVQQMYGEKGDNPLKGILAKLGLGGRKTMQAGAPPVGPQGTATAGAGMGAQMAPPPMAGPPMQRPGMGMSTGSASIGTRGPQMPPQGPPPGQPTPPMGMKPQMAQMPPQPQGPPQGGPQVMGTGGGMQGSGLEAILPILMQLLRR